MADNARTQKTVTITDNNTGKAINLPVTEGSIGPDVIDIRALYAETGMFTFDPGYGATGSCVSGLTYIDGDEGILLHRGYAIEDLAEKADFWSLLTCCWKANYRIRSKKRRLIPRLPVTLWFMNSFQTSIVGSAVTLSYGHLVRCNRSIRILS